MKYIKLILKESLKKQGYTGDVMVSIPKKLGFGDYTSQVLLQNKLNAMQLINEMKKYPLIEKVDVVNGHLNIYVMADLIYSQKDVVEVLTFNRIQVIRDRLYDEGYLEGDIPNYFIPLVKKVNELMISLDELKDADGLEKELINTFKKLDLGYIYRCLSSAELGGIYKLLNTCLLALERANNE